MPTLHHRDAGEGTRPLVLLHGLFGSQQNWLPVARRLSGQFRVHTVDLRNHGASPHAREVSYPLMAAGVLLLPHLRSGRYARLRLGLDAMVGTEPFSIIMWVAYLQDVVVFDSGYSFLENTINAFYGAGDVILLLAVMVLALRRSEYRFDPRLLGLAAGLITAAAADIVYYAQVESGTYADGSWLDVLWLISYGSFIAAALFSTRRRPIAETGYGKARWWQLVAPYGAVIALFTMTLTRIDGTDALLNWASIMVGLLIIARQGVAIRENRELVEKQRDDLVASVSHELRTPLTAVQGYTQLLSEEWEILTESDRLQMIGVVEGQARHLGRIVGDLIEAARDRLQAVELTLEDGSLGDILQQAVDSLPAAARTRVTVQADDGLVVHADLARLRQIVVNLLTNAVRYGRDRILLTARRAEGTVRFQVHDDGPGVQKKYEAVIWERFERGAHRFDSATPGSGIGLPIARALVEAHGGTIHQHRSEVLGGACFEFTIPLPGEALVPEAPRRLPRQAPAAATVGSASPS